MWAGADAYMTLDALLIFYMAKFSDFFGYLYSHRAGSSAFVAAALAFTRLSYLVRRKFLEPAEPEPESADTATESAFAK